MEFPVNVGLLKVVCIYRFRLSWALLKVSWRFTFLSYRQECIIRSFFLHGAVWTNWLVYPLCALLFGPYAYIRSEQNVRDCCYWITVLSPSTQFFCSVFYFTSKLLFVNFWITLAFKTLPSLLRWHACNVVIYVQSPAPFARHILSMLFSFHFHLFFQPKLLRLFQYAICIPEMGTKALFITDWDNAKANSVFMLA